jgi:glucokinase-like ROK family protein
VENETSGSLGSLRAGNRGRVVDALRELGVASRAEIARRTGLSRSTVSSLVAELQEAGLIVDRGDGEEPSRTRHGGRPPIPIALDRSAGVAIGIDFGKRHVSVAVADLAHTILAESRRQLPDDYEADRGVNEAAELIDEVLAEASVDRDSVIGVGLGLPAPIQRATGWVASPTILPGWAGVTVAERMSERLGMPVHVDNDANLGALAELHWGAGRDCSSLAYLKVATGIGAGIVIGEHLFRGVGGTAGEIGHTLIDDEGPICRCGSRGCLETYAATPAIVELLRPSLGDDLTADAMIERAAEGDPGCRRAIGDAGRYIGSALANLCNLFNPERIVVGGTLAATGDVLLDPMRETVDRRAIPSAAEDVEIVAGVLGDRAEVLGAIGLVLYESHHPVTGVSSPMARARPPNAGGSSTSGLAEKNPRTQEARRDVQ